MNPSQWHPFRRFGSNVVLTAAAALIPLAFFILVTFVYPRPYFLEPADLEQDYYFNAKLMHVGLPQYNIGHPGTPIYALSAGMLSLVGDDLAHAQDFFNLGYFLIAVANGLAFCVAARKLFRDQPGGVFFLAMFFVLAFPAWLTYSYTFGGDSFLVPVNLLLLVCFWVSLEFPLERRLLLWVLAGVLAGLSLAIKLTSLAVCLAVMLAAWVYAVLTIKAPEKRLWKALQYIVIPVTASLSFVAFVFPTFARLPQIFIQFFGREEIAPPLSRYAILLNLEPLKLAPYLYIYYAGLALVAAAFLGFLAFRIFKSVKALDAKAMRLLGRGFLVLVLLLIFGYTLASVRSPQGIYSAFIFDPGIFLRNLLPSSLFVFMAIAFVFQDAAAWLRPFAVKTVSWLAALTGVAVFGVVVCGTLIHRQQMIAGLERDYQANLALIESYATPGTRVAVWLGSPANLFGERSFQFWGNYNYGRDAFDDQLLAQYPDYTFFKLREVDRFLGDDGETIQPIGLLGTWKNLFPSPYYLPRNTDIVSGEGQGVDVSVIAFSVDALRSSNLTQVELLKLVRQRFGPCSMEEIQIENSEWDLILIEPAH